MRSLSPWSLPHAGRRAWLALGIAALSISVVVPARSQDPPPPAAAAAEMTRTIDSLVEKRWKESGVTPTPGVDDAGFARRVYLDLAGRIPTPVELAAFVADTSTGKRAALVDKLLASPEYAEHLRDIFDVVFMGRGEGAQPRRRRGGGEVQNARAQWLDYLEQSFAQNRPWSQVVSDLLLARPAGDAERGAVWFLYARQEKFQDIAEAISPAVFGLQIQCAQCHDHPIAPEIKQAHYWGLVAFFNRSKNQNTPQGPRVAESAIGGFSQFATLFGESKPAQLTFLGTDPLPEDRPAPDVKEMDSPELYRPKPETAPKEEPPVPKFSRRELFVERVVQGNPLVARAAVNRFWALLMGRGLVHPVDKMDSVHKPSHPELLDWLAADFEKSGYDVKRLVRSIVLSRPYQLQAKATGTVQPDLFAYGVEKPLTAEMLYRSLMVATSGNTEADNGELLQSLVKVFPDVFAEENIATLRQAMFLTNNPTIQKLVQPHSGSTAEKLAAIADPAQRVKEAFRIAYAREPDAEELKQATAYLQARADRPKEATSQLWWALLTGAEFRFNH